MTIIFVDRAVFYDAGLCRNRKGFFPMIISMMLSLLCGVALFLFGMSLMGDGLKSAAGERLETFLYNMTNTPVKGILLGTAVTAVIQSSAAATVMVIGFVNSGMMSLEQAAAITLGANIGTSITGWVLCLSYVEGTAGIAAILSSSTISAVAAISGTLLRMLAKRSRHKNIGNILLGFAILMTGMHMMSDAVMPLSENGSFTKGVTMFSNPLLGILLGIVMTAILQSASASIGILQALSVTGSITAATAFPVILGIGVGASCPVILSAMGANKNGLRTALAYLVENLAGMILWAIGLYTVNAIYPVSFMQKTVGPVSIALINSCVRIVTAICLFPLIRKMTDFLRIIVKDSEEDIEDIADSADFDLLEERLLMLPALALSQSEKVVLGMSKKVRKNVFRSLNLIREFSEKKYNKIQRKEDLIDKYESKIGDYLMKLSTHPMDSSQTRQLTSCMRVTGDLERMGDYASNIARLVFEAVDEGLVFSEDAQRDLNVMIMAEKELINDTVKSYQERDPEMALLTKPRAAGISFLCEILKARHIGRMSRGECGMEQGAVFTELLNSIDHIASHCVAVSGAVRRQFQENPDYHLHSRSYIELTDERYQEIYNQFVSKYDVIKNASNPISFDDEEE